MDRLEMMITFHMRVLFFFLWIFLSSFGKSLLTCETTSPHDSSYHCNENELQNHHCETFALFFTNSHFSSLSNLTLYLGLNRFSIAETNGFSAETEYLPRNHPLLIPIDCKCKKGGYFQAELTKTTIKGESFYDISQSLEGLTTCKAIKDNNLGVSPWNLDANHKLIIPLKCACPFSSFVIPKPKLLLSYPISENDTISNLALKFHITKEAILIANNLSSSSSEVLRIRSLEPFTSILIPLNANPFLDPLTKPKQPNSDFPRTNNISGIRPHKKSKMKKSELFIGLIGVAIGVFFSVVVTVFFIWLKKRKVEENSCKERDMELQHLNQSVRTTSDKKVSFEGSQDTLDSKIIDATSRKMLLETYTIEDLRKVTEDFSSSFHIEGSVFHGCLNGKNLAIKRVKTEILSKLELGLFHDSLHHHPNILNLLGLSISEESSESESFLVLEYAKNGSLKDWLHGGLAIKNQFIASCYCFLNWKQRLRICVDVASALDYMHNIMSPSYVHRNVKSRNIFLDEEFGAKLGNFGMASFVVNETEDPQFYSSNYASWSIGYLAPEYVHQGVVSTSIDIFAFGVVLLEVLSGQTPINGSSDRGEGSVWLSDKVKSILKSENGDVNELLREWIDSALGESYSFDEALKVANIAKACVEEDACLRPNAREIVEKLSTLLLEELPNEENQVLMSENSCKPLVDALGSNM
ncbi:protein LYK2-like [Vicia villosa]|uniref:protein LYK2-like n=1 Tax=Vicia villosa TaxID=3911 RepID=UPI00273BCABA|nr:protein LYK2-like [Vicia villosa]